MLLLSILNTGTIACKHTPHVLPWPIVKYPFAPQFLPHEFLTIHSAFSVLPTMVIAWLSSNLLQSVKVPSLSTYEDRSPAFIMAATAFLLATSFWIDWQLPNGSVLNPEIRYFFLALLMASWSHLKETPLMDL